MVLVLQATALRCGLSALTVISVRLPGYKQTTYIHHYPAQSHGVAGAHPSWETGRQGLLIETFTSMCNLESPIHLTACLWIVGGVPGENPCRK